MIKFHISLSKFFQPQGLSLRGIYTIKSEILCFKNALIA